MKKQTSVKQNFIMNSILHMSSFIFPLISFPYVSRILSPTGTGKVSFAISLITYFSMFAQLGIPTYGIRACAKVRDDRNELSKTTQELLVINAIMSLLSYAILFAVLLTVPRLQEDRVLYLTVSFIIFLNCIGMEWLYKGLEQYTYITVRSIVFKAISIVAMFLLVHEKNDYVIYGAISIFSSSASNIFNFINARKYVDLFHFRKLDLKRHIRPVSIFFAMSCATIIYTNMDSVMLGFMKDDTAVGYYNAAIKIKQILVSLVTSLGTVLLPRASYYIKNNQIEEFKKIARKAINFVFLFSAPTALYFILFAKQGIYFLSGDTYSGAIIPMKILMITLLLIGLSNVLGIQILVPLGKEKIVLYSEIAGAVVNLVVNSIFIPIIASEGAAIGTVFAELTVLIVQFFGLRDKVSDMFKRISYWKLILALSLSSILSLSVLNFRLGNFVTLVISSIIFFGTYLIVMLLIKEKLVIEIFNQVIEKVDKKNEI